MSEPYGASSRVAHAIDSDVVFIEPAYDGWGCWREDGSNYFMPSGATLTERTAFALTGFQLVVLSVDFSLRNCFLKEGHTVPETARILYDEFLNDPDTPVMHNGWKAFFTAARLA